MACCGLCRPKDKSAGKSDRHITSAKVERIDTWIENIEGPYEPIVLPSIPADEPKTISNQDEIDEARLAQHSSADLRHLRSKSALRAEEHGD